MRFEADYYRNAGQLVTETLLMAGDPLGERWSRENALTALNEAAEMFTLKAQTILDTVQVNLKTDQIHYNIKAIAAGLGKKRYGYPVRLTFNGVREPGMFPISLMEIDLLGYSQIGHTFVSRWHVDSVSPGSIVIFGLPSKEGYEDTGLSFRQEWMRRFREWMRRDSDYGILRGIHDLYGNYIVYDSDHTLRDISGLTTPPDGLPMQGLVAGYEETGETDSPTGLIRRMTVKGEAVTFDGNQALRSFAPFGIAIRNSSGQIIRDIIFISEDNNMQVTYAGLPDTFTEADIIDGVPPAFQDGLTFGAAALLLEEGNESEFRKSAELQAEYFRAIRNCVAETYREETAYDSAVPA